MIHRPWHLIADDADSSEALMSDGKSCRPSPVQSSSFDSSPRSFIVCSDLQQTGHKRQLLGNHSSGQGHFISKYASPNTTRYQINLRQNRQTTKTTKPPNHQNHTTPPTPCPETNSLLCSMPPRRTFSSSLPLNVISGQRTATRPWSPTSGRGELMVSGVKVADGSNGSRLGDEEPDGRRDAGQMGVIARGMRVYRPSVILHPPTRLCSFLVPSYACANPTDPPRNPRSEHWQDVGETRPSRPSSRDH